MKENSFIDKARHTVGRIAPVMQAAATSAIKEAGRNIWEQRKTIARGFTPEVNDSRGIMDAVVVKPIHRQREIFNSIDHREAMMAGLIGGLIGILDHLRSRQSSPQDILTE